MNSSIVIATFLLLAAPGYGEQLPEASKQLARAQRLWQTAKIDAYEFKVRFTCGLCPPEQPPGTPPFEVRAGQSSFKGGAPVHKFRQDFTTVDKLFEFIRVALAKKPVRVAIEYDEKLGYPRNVFIDPSIVVDDEWAFVVEGFTIAQ